MRDMSKVRNGETNRITSKVHHIKRGAAISDCFAVLVDALYH